MADIEDKLSLDYFKLKKTFEGDIKLEESAGDSELKNSKKVDVKPRDENDKELNEILSSINDQYNGILTEDDKVVITTLAAKVKEQTDLQTFAENNDKQVYVQSIFPDFFSKIAQQCYMQQMDAFKKLFENKEFYEAIMRTLGKESFANFNHKPRA